MKKTRFESIAKYYDFFTKVLMMGTYSRVRESIVSLGDDELALDLCCGTGYVTGYIRARKVVGLDLTSGMLEVNRSKNRNTAGIELIQGDAYNLPFKENSFDTVYFTLASHEFRNIVPILLGVHRILKRGGKVVIYDIFKPDNPLLKAYMVFVRHVVEFGKCWIYDLEEWRNLLNHTGFREVDIRVLYKASVLLQGRKEK
jgi:demethylmenaquinone methyltransferase/2-methoxy-6-polyprenyl-1,4-benzoquinol methylase